MSIGTSFNDTALLFLSLVVFLYFLRKNANNIENKLYTGLLVDSWFGNVIAIPLYYLVKYYKNFNIGTYLVPRLYLIYLMVWTFLLSWYIMQITTKKDEKYVYSKNKKVFIIYLIVISILTLFLSMDYYSVNNVVYTSGTVVNFTYAVCAFHILYYIYATFAHFRKIKSKKCIPIICVFVLGSITAIVQKIDPSIRLMTLTISFITTIMYFTIENPDMKMVSELYRNKNIMEQSYEDKSNFLFEITEEVRNPILNINNEIKLLHDTKDLKEYKESINRINGYAKQLEFVVNDVLDVNSMDIQQIKFIKNNYNIELIFNEVVNKINSILPKTVKFSYSISHNIPALYGDSIKIKQILTSILLNSIKHTENGFIDFNINVIERFDAVRLIITVKDSSKGLSIDKINDILATTGSLDPQDIENMNRSDMNLKSCQKIVKLMGGNMLIRTGEDAGSEIVLTIDQRIFKEKEESKILNTYEEYVKKGKLIAVVSQDKALVNNMKSIFSKKNLQGVFLMNGYDLLDRIKGGKKYDYIIVSDTMKKINGYTLLKNLKNLKGFATPVAILIDENNKKLEHHFIDDGFDNCIDINKLESEIEQI